MAAFTKPASDENKRDRPGGTADVFDDAYYASSISKKLVRSLQLGLAYYFRAVPRYLWQRSSLSLPVWDPAVLTNPLREFRVRNYSHFPAPANFQKALARLPEAGARFSLPLIRAEGVAAAWWQARSAIGEVIECGSFWGTTALFLALLGKMNRVPQKVLILDTFKGMPPPSRFDPFRFAGEYAVSKNQVEIIRQRAKTLGVEDRIEVHPGLFSDTFVKLGGRRLRFAFVHIDANLYQGTSEACHFAIPRMSPGGIAVFDDYNGICDLGARLAIDQYFYGKRIRPIPLAASSAYVEQPREQAEKQDGRK